MNANTELVLTCELVLDHATNFFDAILVWLHSSHRKVLLDFFTFVWSFICSVAEDLRDDRKSVDRMIIYGKCWADDDDGTQCGQSVTDGIFCPHNPPSCL